MIDRQTVRFLTTVPNNQYFTIGFGGSMTNVDTVSWEANGNNSNAVDLYSNELSKPA